MTEEAKTMQEQTISDCILERMDWQLKFWIGQNKQAREEVADDANSDWALMGALASAYGRAPQIKRLETYIEIVNDGHASVENVLRAWLEQSMKDLMQVRVNNSSSGAHNLIETEKLYALQQSIELIEGWLVVFGKK